MKEPVILCCARIDGPLLIPDNKVGRCAECNHLVQYRPHAPKPFILRCMECVADLIEPDDTIETTEQMLEDARAYFRRKQQ